MLVNGKVLDERIVHDLILAIQKRKGLNDINKDFVRDTLFEHLKREPKAVKYLNSGKVSPRAENYKQIMKAVRAKLRRSHTLFWEKSILPERKKLIAKLPKTKTYQQFQELAKEILKTHSSTKERQEFYPVLHEKIFKITGKPQTVLDLGAGINPLSLIYLPQFSKVNKKALEYYAYDINEDEITLLNKFFRKTQKFFSNFEGKAEVFDLLHWNKISHMPKVDLCLMFKVTDVLDQGRGHKVTETVIAEIPAKYIVVSFPTVTMSGKRMNHPRRKWFELMCKRLTYEFHHFSTENELFYVVKKLVD